MNTEILYRCTLQPDTACQSFIQPDQFSRIAHIKHCDQHRYDNCQQKDILQGWQHVDQFSDPCIPDHPHSCKYGKNQQCSCPGISIEILPVIHCRKPDYFPQIKLFPFYTAVKQDDKEKQTGGMAGIDKAKTVARSCTFQSESPVIDNSQLTAKYDKKKPAAHDIQFPFHDPAVADADTADHQQETQRN